MSKTLLSPILNTSRKSIKKFTLTIKNSLQQMGNCLRHGSSTQWGGDDWGSPVPDRLFTSNSRQYRSEDKDMMMNMEEEVLLGDNKGMKSSTTITNIGATASTEVKIKITKKQLEELLGRVDMKQLSVEEVLAQLIKGSGDGFEAHQRSWRPNLQSIPE